MNYFRSFLMTRIKSYIAQTFKSQSISIFEIDENLESFSNTIKTRLIPDFLEYGINLKQFFVTGFLKPEGDSIYERFKDLYFRQYADVAEAELQKRVGIIEQEKDAQRMRKWKFFLYLLQLNDSLSLEKSFALNVKSVTAVDDEGFF